MHFPKSFVCSPVVRISDFKEVFVIEKDARRHLKFLKKRKKQLEKKLNDLASSKTLSRQCKDKLYFQLRQNL